ncbi:hypothetical protein FD754_008480 [Muntiacus muntjak]|uniref:Lipoma-preferred partner n=1 Tax=Muntiacus muntjak TaxID=9888 RepID=A0A5N3WS54_MUNMU|nr:hypothetical protein FD754_008480 [Muntiacus muntjak]
MIGKDSCYSQNPIKMIAHRIHHIPGGKEERGKLGRDDAMSGELYSVGILTGITLDLYITIDSINGTTSSTASPPVSTPVTGHKRMVIPNQPPLTATKKSTLKPQPVPQAGPIPVAPIGTLKPQPQPVPASYTTASTPSRPTFNVQVKSAQPSSHYMAAPSPGQFYGSGPGAQGYNTQPVPISGQGPPPSTRGGMDYAYVPPPGLQPEPGYGYAPNQGRYYEPYCPVGPGYGGKNDSDPSYGQQGHPNTWKREQGYTPSGPGNQNPAGMYPVAGPKKTYITDPVPAPCAPPLQPKIPCLIFFGRGLQCSGPCLSISVILQEKCYSPTFNSIRQLKKFLYDSSLVYYFLLKNLFMKRNIIRGFLFYFKKKYSICLCLGNGKETDEATDIVCVCWGALVDEGGGLFHNHNVFPGPSEPSSLKNIKCSLLTGNPLKVTVESLLFAIL